MLLPAVRRDRLPGRISLAAPPRRFRRGRFGPDGSAAGRQEPERACQSLVSSGKGRSRASRCSRKGSRGPGRRLGRPSRARATARTGGRQKGVASSALEGATPPSGQPALGPSSSPGSRVRAGAGARREGDQLVEGAPVADYDLHPLPGFYPGRGWSGNLGDPRDSGRQANHLVVLDHDRPFLVAKQGLQPAQSGN